MLKKLTYIITRSDIGGAQFHTLALLEKFKHSYDILLISGSEGVLSDRARALGIRTMVITQIDSFNVISAIYRIRLALNAEQPDLVHVHSSLASFYGRCAAKLTNIRTLYTVHGWHFSHEPNALKRRIKIAIERGLKWTTSHWITVSNFDHQLGREHNLFRHDCVDTINNGVEPSSTATTRPSGNTLEVVFLGRATYQKNCESAIRVLELTHDDVRLTMFASGGSVEELTTQLSRSSAKHRIRLVLDDPNAAERLKNYSVMLLTSRYEGMPLGALEAMSNGLAVISTDVCGMNEVVKNEVNGYLVAQDNEQIIADKLNSLLTDKGTLRQMGQASFELYEANFTLNRMLTRVSEVYTKLF